MRRRLSLSWRQAATPCRAWAQDVEIGRRRLRSHYELSCLRRLRPDRRNGDGRISNAEWNAYRAGAYRGWDLNGDGRISRREYAQLLVWRRLLHDLSTRPLYEPSWVAFDANHDGWISADEYYSTTAWTSLDRNRDGIVDASEWPW